MATVLEYHPLQNQNMLGLPAVARYCVYAEHMADVEQAVALARDAGLRLLVLGEGSNVVLSDLSNTLVLVMQLIGIEVLQEDKDQVRVRVAAGENWHKFVLYAHQKRWFGLENLALIPGTVGAAPVQNIGAYGIEVSQFVESVQVYDPSAAALCTLSKDECGFEYRHSLFKTDAGRDLIICGLTLVFDRHAQPDFSYPALRAELESGGGRTLAIDILNAVVSIREAKLPDPAVVPNVGSFFKNPVVSAEQFAELRKIAPTVAHWPAGDDIKLAAGWLVEQAGWRGHADERVGIHAKQSLVLVNRGGATADDVLGLAARIQQSVQERFGVELEIEPTVV